MKHPNLTREVYDPRNIKIVGGFGELGASGSDDTDSLISPERIYNTEIQREEDSDEPSNETISPAESKHQSVWSTEYEGKPRVISHGDLKFDLGNRVIAVLPLYLKDGAPISMGAISGEIVDIHSVPVGERDVPREVKLRVSPDASKIKYQSRGKTNSRGESIYSTSNWADNLVVKDWKEERNRVQTMVVSYKILLDPEFRLTHPEVAILWSSTQSMLKLPYRYNTQIQFSTNETTPKKKKKSKNRPKRVLEFITVSYRYIMGLETACKKNLAATKRCETSEITMADIQENISRSKLSSGVFVQYSDIDSEKRQSQILNFVILDHICHAPFDIRFVVRCSGHTRRILAISTMSSFDVRCSYGIEEYHCFHPIDRYVYTIVNPNDAEFDQNANIKEAIQAIFNPIEVYVVKKSLCGPADIEYNVVEDNNGSVKFIPAEKSSGVQPSGPHYAGSSHAKAPYRYSGISIASYVRGLAYPEGNCPVQHDLYTFFNSKDYYEIDLNPDSRTFLSFVCTSGNHTLFRNPMGRDIILAVPFVCDRDQHKGKTNLRWFYPSDEIRLLHLYVKTNGNHPQFKAPNPPRKGIVQDPKLYVRSMFNGSTLCIIDLLLFGLNKNNPTLRSKFTRAFMSQFFWWEKLNVELHQDPNFDPSDE